MIIETIACDGEGCHKEERIDPSEPTGINSLLREERWWQNPYNGEEQYCGECAKSQTWYEGEKSQCQ